jgi:hypothetical protein
MGKEAIFGTLERCMLGTGDLIKWRVKVFSFLLMADI